MNISRHHRAVAAAAATALLWLPSCSGSSALTTEEAALEEVGSAAATSETSTGETPSVVFDSGLVHEISLEFDSVDYAAMIEAYATDGSKEWIEATVTIDGTTYRSAGIRLKGNSSLRGLAEGGGGPGGEISVDTPEELPWLIRLDKYIEGQNHQGVNDFVVRSNNSETALNEAVALDLLEATGLATQAAIAVRFSVNGGDDVLRLVIEHPDDVWMAENLDAGGALYKAESTGDYSYRGDDPEAYDEVFDQEAGKDNTDLTPLIEFLDFINNSDDATFEAEIGDRLDVDAFATYLAMQDIVQNFDDIDGPGNNSYLYYDTDEGQFTVVPWDYNLAFGDAGFGPGGAPGGPPGPIGAGGTGVDGEERQEPPAGLEPPEGFEPPAGFEPGQRPDRGAEAGGPGGRTNVLVERLRAFDEFDSLYQDRLAELTATLIDGGMAEDTIEAWSAVLEQGASDLVSSDTIAADAARLADAL